MSTRRPAPADPGGFASLDDLEALGRAVGVPETLLAPFVHRWGSDPSTARVAASLGAMRRAVADVVAGLERLPAGE